MHGHAYAAVKFGHELCLSAHIYPCTVQCGARTNIHKLLMWWYLMGNGPSLLFKSYYLSLMTTLTLEKMARFFMWNYIHISKPKSQQKCSSCLVFVSLHALAMVRQRQFVCRTYGRYVERGCSTYDTGTGIDIIDRVATCSRVAARHEPATHLKIQG
jgi:hypothetical protein